MMAETEGQPIALSPELNPYEMSASQVKAQLETLKQRYPELKLLYLSTPTETLIQRYSAAEKRHPFEKAGLKDAIDQEQLLYSTLKPLSDYHIDTSTTTDRELTLKIAKVLKIDMGAQAMTVHLKSFGFKHGVPTDAELVFDMRFLPNPFYDESLRPLTGLDKPVKDYVFGFPETKEYLKHWQSLVAHSLPLYQQQGKTRVTIGIGCTGGQHRSVAMTMALSEFLKETFPGYDVRVAHREQNHWPQHTPAPRR